jgi:hypothetical protein
MTRYRDAENAHSRLHNLFGSKVSITINFTRLWTAERLLF